MNSEYVADYEHLEKQHWWWVARREIILSILKKLRQREHHDRKSSLLDVGCGAGINLAFLRDEFDCIGVEPDPVLVEKARSNSGVPVYEGVLPSALPSFDRKFDYIMLLDVLEHIDDDLAALKSVALLLAPGGRIIINVPALPFLWSVHDEVNQHKRRYVMKELQRLISGAGLGVSFIRYWGSLPVPLAYLERRTMWSGAKKEAYRVQTPSSRVNKLLQRILSLEYSLTSSFKVPFGLSLIAIVHIDS